MLAALVLGCTGTAPVAAQTIFLQGGVGAEYRRLSADENDRVFDADASSVTVGVGGFLLPRVSVGIEMDLGAESTVSRAVTVTLGGRPTTVTTDYTSRRWSVSALAGVHSPADRAIRLAVYGGISFSSFRREVVSDAPAIVLTSPAAPDVFTDRTTGAVAGVDVAFRFAPAAAIVGGLRAQGLTLAGDLRGFSIRPSVGARVTF